jgi:hypothetical protein
MAERTFRLLRVQYPLAAVCDTCHKVFTSRSENPDQAEKEVRVAFDQHKCESQSAK